MRIKYLFLLIILTGFWTGCKDSELDSPPIDLSESEFNDVSNEGATLKLEITTGSTWTAFLPMWIGAGRFRKRARVINH